VVARGLLHRALGQGLLEELIDLTNVVHCDLRDPGHFDLAWLTILQAGRWASGVEQIADGLVVDTQEEGM
jgi:hypothetical protein